MIESIKRIGKYTLLRGAILGVTMVVAVYVTILVAGMGGYADKIAEAQIKEAVGQLTLGNPYLYELPAAEREKIIKQIEETERQRFGLDRPFLLRSIDYLLSGLALNFGRASKMYSDTGSSQVRLILLERLPHTLLLWASGSFLVFFAALFAALALCRHYGSPLDRAVVALSPTSAPPAWFYAIFLILIFSSLLRVLPWGGMVDAPPPESKVAYALSVAKHLVLPIAAIFVGAIFASIYNWRTFFLIYSSEDYVEMAKAKGLSSRAIERKYILRPTLPPIITSFALMVIGLWMGGIVLETVFAWPGLGRRLFEAIGLNEIPVVVGSTVIYAYLLALTVFFLDIAYALLDPRVKLGAQGRKL